MLAYRNDERECEPAKALRRLKDRTHRASRGGTHDDVRALFIEFGELEAALADWACPEQDEVHPLTAALRDGARASGHALLASWRSDTDRARAALFNLSRTLETIETQPLPRTVRVRVSEGYAYYSLHPETYAVAAERFARERHPEDAVCIGVRSIGTSLSAIVAASLERQGVRATLHSVRPHGHPFDRRLALGETFARFLQTRPRGCHYLVIDEGPGLSGSSFASVVAGLTELGIDPQAITLFPSWNADAGALRSERGRAVWSAHRRYVAEPAEAGFGIAQVAGMPEDRLIDFSAGAWRPHVLGNARSWPAVQPQHEVPKAWLPREGLIVRFGGIGQYGAAKFDRALRLADAGLGAAVEWMRGGYLSLRFLAGSTAERVSPSLVDRLADHTAFLVREFPAGRSPAIADLEEMIEINFREGVADAMAPNLGAYRPALADAPCAAIDGRMLPYEWIETAAGAIKVDALDHHASHFFPGVQDAGWDLAMAAFEFGLDHEAQERLLTRYVLQSGDRDVRARMPFYEFAYPAFRLGYATLTRGSLAGSPDAARFERVIDACRARLAQLARTGHDRPVRVTSPSGP